MAKGDKAMVHGTDAERGIKKTVCPVTRDKFAGNAKPILIKVETPDKVHGTLVLGVKLFSTGSFGWFGNDKITIEPDSEMGKALGLTAGMKVQANINLTVVGSKPESK